MDIGETLVDYLLDVHVMEFCPLNPAKSDTNFPAQDV